MKAIYERIVPDKGNPLMVAYKLTVPSFKFFWHYHPEYELTQILCGSGKRIVGDSYKSFQAGDLVLIGPDLPHTWISDKRKVKEKSEATVIQFSESMFGGFAALEIFKKIKLMLSRSRAGLFFKRTESLEKHIQNLLKVRGVERIAALLALLEELSKQKGECLSSSQFEIPKGKENERRINKICAFIQNNASSKVTVSDSSALIHLSSSAFCKFFKKVTGKTFSDYVNEIRIGNACLQLIESDKSISTIASDCGFENLSYFNRIFLKKKGVQPAKYRDLNSDSL